MVRLMAYGKIKKMISSYEGVHLEEIDQKLMRGIFKKNLKDFVEDERELHEKQTLLDRLTIGFLHP